MATLTGSEGDAEPQGEEAPASAILSASAWKAYLVIGLICMAQAFPLNFLQSAVPAIFRGKGLDLEQFWVFSLPLIPYWIKFLWAPYVDSVGSARFGYRRSWILPCTLLGGLVLVALALVPPTLQLLWAAVALLTLYALVMGTQDIAVDAYTLESLKPHQRGVGSGVKVMFETLGEFAALAGLLVVYDRFGWSAAIVSAALLLLMLTTAVLLRPEPRPVPRLRADGQAAQRPSIRLFFLRADTRPIVLLLLAGGIVNAGLVAIAGVFLVDRGFSYTQIGFIMGTVYSVGGLGGSAGSALLITFLGVRRTLFIIGVLGAPASVPLLLLAGGGVNDATLAALALLLPAAVLQALHLAFTVSRMEWSSAVQAGTDFTIHGTIYNIGRTIATALVGPAAAFGGWAALFAVMAGLLVATALGFALTHPWLTRLVAEREARAGS